MNMNSESHPLRKFYRNITFDTLKERHDNFSFNKAIKTKQETFDSMHFQGLYDTPTDPVMIIYKKLGSKPQVTVGNRFNYQTVANNQSNDSNYFKNENYQNFNENPIQYQEFKKQFQQINEEMGISSYSGFSGLNKQKNDQYNDYTKRASYNDNDANTLQKRQESAGILQQNRSYLNKTNEEMWQEFNQHFQNKDRPLIKVNHHDFLDGGFLTKLKGQEVSRKQFFSKIGGQSFERGPYDNNDQELEGDVNVDLGRHRIVQTRKNYAKLQVNSYEIKLNKEKAGIPKWLQQKLKAEGKSNLESKVYQYEKAKLSSKLKNDFQQQNTIDGSKQAKTIFNNNKKNILEKNYQQRHIFVLADGQNILDSNLKFTYVEINDRLAQFVHEKIWKSEAAQKLTLNQKIEKSMPSQALNERCMSEIIEEVSEKIGEQYETAYLIDGQHMKTPLEMPLQARILIVSKNNEFQGISGLEHFNPSSLKFSTHKQNVGGATYVNNVKPQIKVKPQPETWIHMAQSKWVKNNQTDKIPSYSEGGPNDQETQNKIIDAIQEEQNRVYKQDQKLIQRLRSAPEPDQQSDEGDYEQRENQLNEAEEYYEFKQLEDDIIKYICEKIVSMREQPFIDAVVNLKRAQELNNLQMIMDMQRNKQKINSNLNNYTSAITNNAGLSSIGGSVSQTPSLDGLNTAGMSQAQYQKMLMNQYVQAQESYAVTEDKVKNKVTFKVRQEGEQEQENTNEQSQRGLTAQSVKRKKKQSTNQDEDPNRAGRMLKTDEIRDICKKNGLTRMEVYNIRSQFAGMCLMSKEDELKEKSALKVVQDKSKSGKQKAKGKNNAADQGDGAQGRQTEGIGLKFFQKNCSFLAGCLPQIVERILIAHGLDIQSSNTCIDWHTYLDLYCIFEAGKMDQQTLIRFWIKFFDNGLRGFVAEDEYMQVLEELVRGNTLNKASKTTVMFAKMFQKMMRNADCLGENNEIINEKLSSAFEREDIDIQLLCSALGRQQLDEKFLNVEVGSQE